MSEPKILRYADIQRITASHHHCDGKDCACDCGRVYKTADSGSFSERDCFLSRRGRYAPDCEHFPTEKPGA